METMQNPPRKFAIVTHPSQQAAAEDAVRVLDHLKGLGVDHAFSSSIYDAELKQQLRDGNVDVLIAMGGDGTMLRAGHLVAPLGIPILGINRGRFGFLMEIDQSGCLERMDELYEGRFRLEERMMLRAVHKRMEEELGEWHVLNEVVVCRGQYVRPIELKASLDGYELARYVADGLIAATPTGSTAYALAVGGPIMPPELRNILIVPVAPHLSVDRPIILEEGARVTIMVRTSHQAVLSADGQPPILLKDNDTVEVCASEYSAKFVRFQDQGYFYRNLTKYMEQNPITGGLS